MRCSRWPMVVVLALFAACACGILRGQTQSGSITGTIKDATGAVIAGAQIVLQPGGTTVASNAQGDFRIQNIKPGNYTVTVSDVGFENSVSTVTVTAGQTALLNASMSVASADQEVVVKGTLQGDVAAINEQRTSENILNVMTAPEIANLPNQSVATVLGRMPGVTVQINEGEAQYVQIRGTEPRLSNTTMDGVLVPGPDPQVRQVDLWVIPADLMGAVEINKTLSANEDGDAIGGSVNMQMRQATSNHPTLDLESLGGWNPIDTGQPWIRDDATVGKRFGAKQRFGLMFSYSYDLNDLGTDDVEPVPDLSLDGCDDLQLISISQYFYNHTRYGFGGSADYKLNEGSDFFAHGLFSNFKDYGQKYEYDISSNEVTQGNSNPSPGISFSNSLRRPNYQISLLTLGGHQIFNRSWAKYVVSVGHSREGGAAGNPGADFDTINPAVGADCAYDPAATVSIHRPQFNCGSDPIYDPTQYALHDVNLTSGDATQLNLTAAGAYGLNYHLGSHASTLEFGAQVRNAHKGQFAYSPTYDNFAGTATPPLMSMFTSNFTDPSFYGGSYKMGPVTHFELISQWLANNPDVLPLDEAATHLNSDASNYTLQERITAGYAMNTWNWAAAPASRRVCASRRPTSPIPAISWSTTPMATMFQRLRYTPPAPISVLCPACSSATASIRIRISAPSMGAESPGPILTTWCPIRHWMSRVPPIRKVSATQRWSPNMPTTTTSFMKDFCRRWA